MRITSVEINNYKSIGNTSNLLLLDPDKTALIGKNESGKSNVLQAIGNLSFISDLTTNYLNQKNRITGEEISINIDLEFYEKELEDYNISQSMTRIEFNGTTIIKFRGGLSGLISKDNELLEAVKYISEVKKVRNVWKYTDRDRINRKNQLIDRLENITKQIYSDHTAQLKKLKNHVANKYKNRVELYEKIDVISEKLGEYYNLLPKIYFRESDRILDDKYNISGN